MPNKKAAIKDLRKNRKRAAHNLRIKKNVKALVKETRELIAAGKKEEAATKLRLLQSAADKAAKRGVMHKNSAGRRKASAMKALNKK